MSNASWEKPSKVLTKIIEGYNVNGFEAPGGTDKNTIHNYTGIYEHILSPYVEKEGKLLEIGVQHGGSSLLWQSYLPRFTICMVDIHDIVNQRIWDLMDANNNDYSFYETNAYDDSFVEQLTEEWGSFDIIIDDGPHTLGSQVYAVQHYLPLLAEGGVFAIEDIQDIRHVTDLTNAVPDQLKDNVKVYDVRNTKGRYDDIIFTVTR